MCNQVDIGGNIRKILNSNNGISRSELLSRLRMKRNFLLNITNGKKQFTPEDIRDRFWLELFSYGLNVDYKELLIDKDIYKIYYQERKVHPRKNFENAKKNILLKAYSLEIFSFKEMYLTSRFKRPNMLMLYDNEDLSPNNFDKLVNAIIDLGRKTFKMQNPIELFGDKLFEEE